MHYLKENWTFKIAENHAIAEKIQLLELSAIVGFYCNLILMFPLIFMSNHQLRSLNFYNDMQVWKPWFFSLNCKKRFQMIDNANFDEIYNFTNEPWRLVQKELHMIKIWLLTKNPQFLSYHHEIWSKRPTQEFVIWPSFIMIAQKL